MPRKTVGVETHRKAARESPDREVGLGGSKDPENSLPEFEEALRRTRRILARSHGE